MSTVLQQGWADYEHGRYPEALRAAETVLTLSADQPMALVLKAMCQMWLTGDVAAAVRSLKKLIRQMPQTWFLHYQLGTALGFSGDMAGAEQALERALALDPRNFGTFHILTQIKKYSVMDAKSERMLALAEAGGLSDAEASPLHFGLAKIFADLREYERAFTHVIKANAGADGHYNPADSERHLGSLIQLRDSGHFAGLQSSGSGIGSERPLFIVGMPRSGTTLVETILSRHSKVRACGELPDIVDIERQLTAQMRLRAGKSLTDLQAMLMATPDDLKVFGEAMLDKVHGLGKGTYRVFTDKMPPNGLRLGLIARLFPKARVIVMQRDGRDCGVSNLFQRFPAPYAYTRRMDWLGHYAQYFAASVGVWRQMVELRTMDVRYETLVTDPEPTIREILEFAGLGFEAACLHPERGAASIKTASVWQARQAINAGSVGRWANYEPWLGPLITALDTPLGSHSETKF